jgi:hypothetical protein
MPGSVIVGGARTPTGRLLGSLAGFSAADLGGFAIKAALERAGISGEQVGYVVMGQVLQAGAGQIPARQAAVNAGANTSSGLHFEVTDLAKGRDEGLRAAFADAREKAALLAHAAGRTLGRTLKITEGMQAAPPIPLPRAATRAEAVVTEVPVASGTQETTYTVSAVFELR